MLTPDLTYQVTIVEIAQRAVLCVLCKQHYSYDWSRREVVADPEFYRPMVDDYEYARHDARNGRLLAHGRDTWPTKSGTDVVVQGHAYAPPGVTTTTMPVSVTVGGVSKEILVLGDRPAYLHGSTVHFGAPAPFEKVSLDWWNAYGGVDVNYLPKNLQDTPMIMGVPVVELFPGAFPRNPLGVGYVVGPAGFVDGMLLPNLEDPRDRLIPERFFVGQPQNWWKQPMPQGFGWMPSLSFPRCIHAGYRPYHMPDQKTQEQLPELRSGWVSPSQLQLRLGELSLSPRMTSEAAPGMRFSSLAPNTMFRLEGMSAHGAMTFRLPLTPPAVTVKNTATNRSYEAAPHVHTVHILPDAGTVSVVWGVRFELGEVETQTIADGVGIDELVRRYAVEVAGVPLERKHWPLSRETTDSDYVR